MKTLSKLFVAIFFALVLALPINAQELPGGTPAENAPANNDVQLPIGEAINDQPTEEGNGNTNTVSEEATQSFTTGILTGAGVGLIVGAILAWLLKDKIYRNN